MSTQQPTYLTIVYHITDQQQVKHLLEHTDWSAASHSHAIHERDEACKQRDELLEALRGLLAAVQHSVCENSGPAQDAASAAIAQATGSEV